MLALQEIKTVIREYTNQQAVQLTYENNFNSKRITDKIILFCDRLACTNRQGALLPLRVMVNKCKYWVKWKLAFCINVVQQLQSPGSRLRIELFFIYGCAGLTTCLLCHTETDHFMEPTNVRRAPRNTRILTQSCLVLDFNKMSFSQNSEINKINHRCRKCACA